MEGPAKDQPIPPTTPNRCPSQAGSHCGRRAGHHLRPDSPRWKSAPIHCPDPSWDCGALGVPARACRGAVCACGLVTGNRHPSPDRASPIGPGVVFSGRSPRVDHAGLAGGQRAAEDGDRAGSDGYLVAGVVFGRCGGGGGVVAVDFGMPFRAWPGAGSVKPRGSHQELTRTRKSSSSRGCRLRPGRGRRTRRGRWRWPGRSSSDQSPLFMGGASGGEPLSSEASAPARKRRRRKTGWARRSAQDLGEGAQRRCRRWPSRTR